MAQTKQYFRAVESHAGNGDSFIRNNLYLLDPAQVDSGSKRFFRPIEPGKPKTLKKTRITEWLRGEE